MSREQALLIGAVVLAFLAACLFSPWSPLARKAAPDGFQGSTWSPAQPYQHVTSGGLYHPQVCGEGRTGLIQHGWEWIANPPSEVTGPGYA